MLARRARDLGPVCRARWGGPLLRGGGTTRELALCGGRLHTALRGREGTTVPAQGSGAAAARFQRWGVGSPSTANFGRRSRLIREKIIGHRMRGLATAGRIRCSFLDHRMFALLHEPARQQGRGILFEPAIQQRHNFLAEIGRMVQARQFVAVKGIARSGEQELPIGLSFVIQGDLQEGTRRQ